MAVTFKADFHMHSSVSDGTDSPEELLEQVRRSGISVFSVTDHDTLEGTKQIRSYLKDGDPVFINGIEFSCQDEDGKYHILGYNYDPDASSLVDTVALAHSYREEKARLRIDFIVNELGINLPKEEIDGFLALQNPGKPHLAAILVKYGYAENITRAIEDILNKFKYPSRYIRPEQAISGILKSGGIPVLAHPIFGSGDQLILGQDMEDRLKKLTGFGLLGIEAFYSEFTPGQRESVLDLASRYNLYVTAGSDYHGKNNNVAIGENGLNEADFLPLGMERFIEKIRKERR